MLSDERVRRYTEGDCWLLAWHLSELTGLLVLLSGSRRGWHHAGVVTPDRRAVLDVQGWSSLRRWRGEWCAEGQRTSTVPRLGWHEYVRAVDRRRLVDPERPSCFGASHATVRRDAALVLARSTELLRSAEAYANASMEW